MKLAYEFRSIAPSVEGLHRHETVRVLKEARRFLRWATPLPSRGQTAVFLRGASVQRMLRRPQEQTLNHEIKQGGLAGEHSRIRCG